MSQDTRGETERARIVRELANIEARLIAARHLHLTDRIRLLEHEKSRLEIGLAELGEGGNPVSRGDRPPWVPDHPARRQTGSTQERRRSLKVARSPSGRRSTRTAPRLNPYKAAPDAMKAMAALENYVQTSGLEPALIDLIKTRASQINGCAYCIHMHTREARTRGESEERLYLLDAWHESPLYSARERAALAWTEAVTLVSQTHVPDDVYDEARRHFSEEELVKLTLAVAAINSWNRLAIGFRSIPPPGRHDTA